MLDKPKTWAFSLFAQTPQLNGKILLKTFKKVRF